MTGNILYKYPREFDLHMNTELFQGSSWDLHDAISTLKARMFAEAFDRLEAIAPRLASWRGPRADALEVTVHEEDGVSVLRVNITRHVRESANILQDIYNACGYMPEIEIEWDEEGDPFKRLIKEVYINVILGRLE